LNKPTAPVRRGTAKEKTMKGGKRPGAGRPKGTKDRTPRKPRPNPAKERISSVVTPEVAREIEYRAKVSGKTKSAIISEILESMFQGQYLNHEKK
jgi:hypothetical protein